MIKTIDVTTLKPEQIKQIESMIEVLKKQNNLENKMINDHNFSDVNDFDSLLENTKGIWTHGDGLTYQRKLRQEWA